MKKVLIFLLVVLFVTSPLFGNVSAKLDLDGACKITQLKDKQILVQKCQWKRDGNHTCTSVDVYEYKDRQMVFDRTVTCEEAETIYQQYKGDDYIREK